MIRRVTGYKICGRIYLNGDGIGKGTHVSLFFVLMRGDYDALLPWPFRQKIIFKLLNQSQQKDLVDTFRPDQASSSFCRPMAQMNVASGCPMFAKLDLLQETQSAYVKDDVMFIQMEVEAATSQ